MLSLTPTGFREVARRLQSRNVAADTKRGKEGRLALVLTTHEDGQTGGWNLLGVEAARRWRARLGKADQAALE